MSRDRRPIALAAAVALSALGYAGGYAFARSQGWIVHLAYRDELTNTVVGHDLSRGRASGEIGGVAGVVPGAIAASPRLTGAWIAGFLHAHRAYTPLMLAEEAAWQVIEPDGTPWRYY
jgi:hypothetical protein